MSFPVSRRGPLIKYDLWNTRLAWKSMEGFKIQVFSQQLCGLKGVIISRPWTWFNFCEQSFCQKDVICYPGTSLPASEANRRYVHQRTVRNFLIFLSSQSMNRLSVSIIGEYIRNRLSTVLHKWLSNKKDHLRSGERFANSARHRSWLLQPWRRHVPKNKIYI